MEGFAVLRAASSPASLRSRCAPFRTRSTSPIERAGASTMRWPRSTPRCRGCSLSSPDEARLAARGGARARRRRVLVAGLTVYFSAENVPPCLVSGATTWRRAERQRTHRYEVVFLDRAACFFDMDDSSDSSARCLFRGARASRPRAAGRRRRGPCGVRRLHARSSQRQPFAGRTRAVLVDILTSSDGQHHVMYVTRPGCSASACSIPSAASLYDVRFKGFTWNPQLRARPAESRPLARARPSRALGARRPEQHACTSST